MTKILAEYNYFTFVFDIMPKTVVLQDLWEGDTQGSRHLLPLIS